MKKIVGFLDRMASRYTPDPLVIAILIAALVVVSAIWKTGSVNQPLLSWYEGFWTLITFTLQMAMMLLCGYTLANTPPVKKLLSQIASRITSPLSAIMITTLVSSIACWLNWGFGLVVGAVFALEIGKKLKRINYRLLVASAYSGFVLWHAGLSGSIPLLLNTEGNFSFEMLGKILPLSETTFSFFNIALVLLVLLTLFVTNFFLFRNAGQEYNELHIPQVSEQEWPENSPAAKINRSKYILSIVMLLGLGSLLVKVKQDGFRLDLNSMNYLLLILAMIFHKDMLSFLHTVKEGGKKITPILIQYPIYAAIMTVLKDSGLAASISQFFINISSADTLPLFSFYSAGLLNLLVPSGGGQWAVQAPVILPAVQSLGADLTKSVMAVAWGDAWTNLLQPFWAIPLLSIANLHIKDILAYCFLFLLSTGMVISLAIMLI
tara:strand:- start:22630 stop:23934 length:1305 start_codon:yes stop_codon:yes gene_type:complete